MEILGADHEDQYSIEEDFIIWYSCRNAFAVAKNIFPQLFKHLVKSYCIYVIEIFEWNDTVKIKPMNNNTGEEIEGVLTIYKDFLVWSFCAYIGCCFTLLILGLVEDHYFLY